MVYKEEGRIFNGKNCFKARKCLIQNSRCLIIPSEWWEERNETKVSGKGHTNCSKGPSNVIF